MTNKEIKVGDIVKCWGFRPIPGRGDCYKIGRVIGFVNDSQMEVSVIEDIWEGKVWNGLKAVSFVTWKPDMMDDSDWSGRVEVL